jgi:hypothetical protein
MNFSQKKIGKFQLRVSVEAFALLGVLLSLPCAASTGSSWSDQPSWASDLTSEPSGPPPRRQRSVSKQALSSDVSPFSPGSNNVSVDVGQVFLLGDLGRYENSIGTQINYTYGVSELFGFESSLGYSSTSDNNGGGLSMVDALSGLRMNLSWYDKVIPYGVVGLGFYHPGYSGAGASSSSSPLLFGIHAGPGIDLALTKQIFFGTALTFNDMFGSSTVVYNGTSQSVGGIFATFYVHAGFTF